MTFSSESVEMQKLAQAIFGHRMTTSEAASVHETELAPDSPGRMQCSFNPTSTRGKHEGAASAADHRDRLQSEYDNTTNPKHDGEQSGFWT